MFLKNFRVKSNTAIRGSDRRKLRSDISKAFPGLSQNDLQELIPNKEEITVMKVLTHSGHNIPVYFLNGEPMFFEMDRQVIPSVYTLWKFPEILLSFTTWPVVFDKFKRGADLMLPGVVLPSNGLSSFGQFEKGTICSVCLKGNRYWHLFIGLTLYFLTNCKTFESPHQVNVPFCRAQGSKTPLPQLAELEDQFVVDEGPSVNADEENNALKNSETDHGEESSTEACEERNVDFPEEQNDNDPNPQEYATSTAHEKDETPLVEETISEEGANCQESQLDNMDDLLEYCFFCSLLRMKKVEFPVLTGTFFRSYLLPCRPEGKTVDIKKSSYKKLSKFLHCMQERGLIMVQEASKGVDHITAIAWDHPELKEFKLNRPLLETVTTSPPQYATSSSGQAYQVRFYFSQHRGCVSTLVSHICVDQICFLFINSKGSVLSPADVRLVVTNYVKSHELMSAESKRMVTLDPTLTKMLINKNEDVEILAWDQLFERVFSKMNKCHQITFQGQDPVIRKGKIEAIEIKVEQRTGNKKVTLIRNLESYGIEPQEFAHKIQIKAACSTAVTQLPGKNINPGMQILAQGNQVALVANFLLGKLSVMLS
ncbi:PREDICTED: eukaryotic translation initiation factor 2D-like [Acropora digitifera]|uniref:eukaryotic translation initiation factor 2D-like n=1 Tax=Acropora digitifera TaxID=70779 RepID=UPI00077B088F|nr:PREDICTED: eukaryotic translation initiation factor 2D-like [Acropora digitifera]